MRLRSSSASAIVVSLLAKDVMAAVHGGHLHHHRKRTQMDVTVTDDVVETMIETIYVTVDWPSGETIGVEYPTDWPGPPASTSSPASASSAPPVVKVAASSPAHSVAPSPAPVIPASSPSPKDAVVEKPTPTPAAEPVKAAPAPVPTTMATIVKPKPTPAAAPPSNSGGSSSGGSSKKRGLAYNTASLTDVFDGDNSQISWAYNWGSSSSGLTGPFEYVPMLWSNQPDKTGPWNAAASAALASGTTHLFSFNEPDLGSQANMDVNDAAAAYKTYMEPFAGKAQLGAPAVTNGGGDMGLTYLSNFISACSSCTIDFVNIHWYDSATNFAYFKSHVQQAYTAGGGRPVWITEFGASGSLDDQNAFLEVVLPWLDAQDYVQRYAYFMCADGVLLQGTSLSSLGSTFKSFTSSTISSLIA